MSDHPILIHMWKILNAKKHVLLLVDEDTEDSVIVGIFEWFRPIAKQYHSDRDIEMKNGSFLSLRVLLNNMPPMNNALKDWEILALDTKQTNSLKEYFDE
jgi:hypothetical protein